MKNSVCHARTKHIDTRYHFVQEELENKVTIITTKAMIADILTKSLPKFQFVKLQHALGMDLINLCLEKRKKWECC